MKATIADMIFRWVVKYNIPIPDIVNSKLKGCPFFGEGIMIKYTRIACIYEYLYIYLYIYTE